MDVSEDVTATLRAEAHHPPVVTDSAGFCTEHSAKSRSIGYEEERSPTLRAGVVPAAFAVENHPTDSRVKVSEDGKIQTLTSRMGTGGNNVPLVMKIRCGCEGGGKGPLIQTDKSATLATNNDQTVFVPAVFGICSKDSNSMKSDNPKSGFYKAETTRTLDANGGNPSCNQGGMAVVALEGNGARPSHHGPGYSEEDVSFTLNATEQHAVAHPIYSTSKASYHTGVEENLVNTLVATDYKDPPTIASEPYYIVRRLTPTECARLQGFPDWWCSALETVEPTEEDISFWREVFETHRKITNSAAKPKTDRQIVKWLKDPHTDSAEYKLWGNGVALPCVCFVLAGIVYYDRFRD